MCGKVGRYVQHFASSNMRYCRGLYHGLHLRTSAPRRSVLVSNWPIYNCQDWVKFFKSLSLFSSKMEDNTHTFKQAYVRQPNPSQTTYKPHETQRPQPTRLYEPFFYLCVVVLFVVDLLLQQYHTIHGTTHEVLLCWL